MTNLSTKSLLNSGKYSPAANYLRDDCIAFGLNFADTVQDLIASNGLNLVVNESCHFVEAGDVDWSIQDFDHTLRYEFFEDNTGEGVFGAHVIEFDRYGYARKHWTE